MPSPKSGDCMLIILKGYLSICRNCDGCIRYYYLFLVPRFNSWQQSNGNHLLVRRKRIKMETSWKCGKLFPVKIKMPWSKAEDLNVELTVLNRNCWVWIMRCILQHWDFQLHGIWYNDVNCILCNDMLLVYDVNCMMNEAWV